MHNACITVILQSAKAVLLDHGMLHQALGKRGWLNTIFDELVKDQRIPLTSTCLEHVVVRGHRLAAFAERARTPGSG